VQNSQLVLADSYITEWWEFQLLCCLYFIIT